MNKPTMKILLTGLLVLGLLGPAGAQQSYPSAQGAVEALTAALKANDAATLNAIFGPKSESLLKSGDPQADANARQRFLTQLEQKLELVNERGATFLHIGAEGWAFPIPLKEKAGQWAFDLQAGEKDLLARRIGANELNAIGVCRAIAQAQREYFSVDWNGNRVLEYARKIQSSPGARDGLYWPPKPGGLEAPLGPLVGEAQHEGYDTTRQTRTPYHGYYFRILTAQGPHAPGRAYSYIINGNMVAGFAVLAWPAQWGNSGVTTFMLAANGDLYERNLGPQTASLVNQIEAFDPSPGWLLTKGDR